MKIFIDVGTYKGETLIVAMEKQHGFDKLYCFEPTPKYCERIRKIADDRVEIFEGGMWNKTRIKRFYNPGSLGASLFKEKNGDKYGYLEIQVVSASEWFKKNIKKKDQVYLKLNCEGAEWAILDDLIKSGEYKKIKVLMVDLDIRKIPSQKHLFQETKDRIKTLGIPKVYFADEYGRVNHEQFTHYWLTETNENIT
jgi:FkbM family methyltransferase